jgi:hypothetical protein
MANILSNLARFSEMMAAEMRTRREAEQKAEQARLDAIIITPEQKRFVELSLTEFDGAFPVHALARRANVTSHTIRTVAEAWEAAGLLTPFEGGNAARRVTPRLANLARSVRQGG